MPFLTLDQIDAVEDRPTKVVHMPEWGGDILVRGLSMAQYHTIQADTKDNPAGLEVATLVACVAEPKIDAAAAVMLQGKSVFAFARVMKAIAEVNGAAPEAITEAKSVAAGGPDGDVRDASGPPAEDDGPAAPADDAPAGVHPVGSISPA